MDGYSSDNLPVTSGIPQGTMLGPLLFLCYINDLPECVSCNIRLYADDVLLYNIIESEKDCLQLQSDLNALEHWEKTWQMKFNTLKCQYIFYGNKWTPIQKVYTIHGEPLQQVSSIKYLGVIIDKRITWNEHTDRLVHKANKVGGFLYRNFKNCPIHVKKKCYETLVRPILEYASTVWSPYYIKNINRIEAVQRRMARFVFNDYDRTTSVTELLRQLSWPSLQQRRLCDRTLMIFKIIHNLVDIPVEPPNFIPNTIFTRGNTQKFIQLQSNIDCYAKSFFPEAIKIWNSLPQLMIDCNDAESFKHYICNYFDCIS